MKASRETVLWQVQHRQKTLTETERRDRMAYRGLMELLPLNHIPVRELTNSISSAAPC